MQYPLGIINITQHFGEHLLDYSQFGLKGHNGTDFKAPRGTPIKAIHDGWIIEQTARETGFGLRITQRIEFDGQYFMVVYGHMERLESDQNIPYDWNNKQYPVKAGQVIGYVDSTGFSTGDHLHLGLYPQDKDGNKLYSNNGYGGAIDAEPYFKGNIMEILQVEGKQDVVIKNLDGRFYPIATRPDLYPYVAEIFGLKDKKLNTVTQAEVDANLGGYAKAGITFVEK